MPSEKESDVDNNAVTLMRGGIGAHDGPKRPSGLTSITRLTELNLAPAPLDDGGFGARYEMGDVIGEGGMGEVRLAKDRRIGREVAMKVIRSEYRDRSDIRMRFEREVRVQGQLEHPSVVPVYDLGVTPDGDAYFTMKRLGGMTLEEIIERLHEGDPEITRTYTRRRLLTAFTNLCLGIAFAHSRGVLHRDLKPSNVMLGAFGEVHVLDWGLAKVAAQISLSEGESIEAPVIAESMTAMGEVMGTPGYMSPEQALGAIDLLDARTDVYSLGALLFEVLTLEPLHADAAIDEMIGAMVREVNARASERAPGRDIPAELDTICIRATAHSLDDRYQSALELYEAVELFLDGDRDIERRRAMADAHAAAAYEGAGLARLGGEDATSVRAWAMREASVALALSPEHEGAVQTLLELMIDAPTTMSPEAQKEFEEHQREVGRESRRSTFYGYLACLLFAPAAMALGIRDWVFAATLGLLMAVAALLAWLSERAWRSETAPFIVYCVGTLAIALSTGVLGWGILVPGMAATHTAGFFVYGDRRHRIPALVLGALAVLGPFTLQLVGVMPSSYTFDNGVALIHPQITELPGTGTMIFLLLASVGLVIGPTLAMARVRDSLLKAEERLFLHAWNMRHLMPREAREAAPLSSGKARSFMRKRAPVASPPS